jgi:ubiquinone biosynthesis protein
VVQVTVPQNPASTEFGAAERTRAAAAGDELAAYTRQLAGERGHAFVVVDADPALAIVRTAEREAVDVLVVGNFGMAGRKEFLLGNVPNRISHNARCSVIIVNTVPSGECAPTVASFATPKPSLPQPSLGWRPEARISPP